MLTQAVTAGYHQAAWKLKKRAHAMMPQPSCFGLNAWTRPERDSSLMLKIRLGIILPQ